MKLKKTEEILQTEHDPLELKKFVDQILRELNDYDKSRLKLKRRAYSKRKTKQEKEIFELKELPFVF